MQIAQVWLQGSSLACDLENSQVFSHLSPYFFTARRADQSDSLDKSPKLQLCHDWQLGQNTEGSNLTVYFRAIFVCLFFVNIG